MDGINSMTGNPPRLAEFAALAREHDRLIRDRRTQTAMHASAHEERGGPDRGGATRVRQPGMEREERRLDREGDEEPEEQRERGQRHREPRLPDPVRAERR